MREEAATTILDPEDWDRLGGREFQFFATDAEVRDWLVQALPTKYAPYRLLGADVVSDGERYVQQPFRCEIEELPSCIRRSPPLRTNFWLWSEGLTPRLELHRGERVDAVCGLNGLVLLQQGGMRRERRDVSRIAILDKVGHRLTGEIVQHTGYLEVFQALRKRIKKAVCYTTVWLYPNGMEFEDDRLGPWTEGAVREHEAGVLFVARPGRPLPKKGAAPKR
jgi:hypothetical protein